MRVTGPLFLGLVLVLVAGTSNAQLSLDEAKKTCTDLGYKVEADVFLNCALRLTRLEESRSVAPRQQSGPSSKAANVLPSCPGDTVLNWSNCIGNVTLANGDKYVGEWRDGKMNGQGTYTYSNGNRYVGEWWDDKKNGRGIYTWSNGNSYVGGWRDDKHHGQGTHTWPGGAKYVGEWRDGQPVN